MSNLLDTRIIGEMENAVDFIINILQASTEYSIIGKNLDGTVLLWNEGARRLYGYEPEEVVGKANSAILHTIEDVAAGKPCEILEAALCKGKWEGTIQRRRKNGEYFTARVVITPRCDIRGKPTGFLLISKDISNEIQLTEELKATQLYTRSLIESSIDALITTDPLGIITDVNQQTEALTGCTREELIGTPFKNYFTNPKHAEEGIKLVLREGKVTNYELTAQAKEGHKTVVSYNASIFHDIQGRLQGVFAAARDITTQKQLEQQLRDSQAYNRGLIESSVDGLITVDPSGTISDVNARMCQMTGYSREELISTPFADYFVDAEQAEAGVKETFEKGIVTDYALTLATRDKQHLRVSFNASVFLDPAGQVCGIFASARDITEQAILQTQLEEERAYNRGLIEASVDGLVTVDETMIITDVNDTMCRLVGRPRLQLIGSSFPSYFTERERAAKGVLLTFKEGAVTNYVLTLQGKGGCQVPVSFNAAVFKDTTGQVRGIFASARDITAQKQLENELQSSQYYTRSLIESNIDALMTTDLLGIITDVNQQMESLTSVARSELIGSPFKIYFTNPERAEQGIKRVLHEGRVTNYELTARAKDGRETLVSYNATTFNDRDGKLQGVFAAARDITEQKKLERQLHEQTLQESAAWLRAIINAVPDLLLVLDEDGRYVEALTTQPHLLYTEPATFQGKLLNEVLPAELAQQALQAIHQTLLTRQLQTLEYAVHIAQTGQRYFEARATPLELPSATKPAVVVLVRDITEQRLTEESLRQAQKMEAVGQLTGGVAHDFNNLLGIILGNLDLLAEALDRPELQDLVQRSVEAAERGATLVRRLLAFARRQPLQAKSVDLNRLIAGMIELLRLTLGETIQVETVLAEDLAQVVVDPSRFETALLNLALNARDAMPNGGRFTVETANLWLDEDYAAVHQPVQPGPYVLLAVSDTGHGMPSEVVEHAFEPFFTTKEVGKGSGLGLSMVYGLVNQSQGHIQLYSEVGRGTVIKIYLPPRTVATRPALAARLPEAPLPAGQGQTILVVEDEPAMRQLAVSMLQSLGYQTVEADTAASALQILKTTPQVVMMFTDVVLPGGMNGVDLARTAYERRPDLKVLFTSGYTDSHLTSVSHHLPGMEWLSKPYRKSQLAIKLHVLLDLRAP